MIGSVDDGIFQIPVLTVDRFAQCHGEVDRAGVSTAPGVAQRDCSTCIRQHGSAPYWHWCADDDAEDLSESNGLKSAGLQSMPPSGWPCSTPEEEGQVRMHLTVHIPGLCQSYSLPAQKQLPRRLLSLIIPRKYKTS